MHACLRWTGCAWELKDLASTNGTYHNGQRLSRHEPRTLSAGDWVAFGDGTLAWQVIDATAPSAMVIAVDSGVAEYPEDGVLALPSPVQPVVTLFANADGCWFIETAQGTERLVDQQVLEVGGRSWRFCAPAAFSATDFVARPEGPLLLAQLDVGLRVSGDEDHVEIILSRNGQQRLLKSRACHYLLLTLERQRQRKGIADEWGWMETDDICRLLHIDEQQLSTDIFRLRQQFARAGVTDYANIIERRTRPSKIRIGSTRVSVERG